mgnify:CR=1 FL=1
MLKNNFEGLGLSNDLLHSIQQKGFEEPTEIQEKIIPVILKNDCDVIGQAQTGTGKTAAFALPILQLLGDSTKEIQVLVIVPTRELAIQVADEINSLRGKKNIHVSPIYGGQSYETQFRILKKGVDIIVGTPGRIIDLLNRDKLKLDSVKFVVLDEADEMLNMGFIDDIEEILSKTNEKRRTFLFSATMPTRIMNIAKKYMKNHEIVRTKKSGQTTELTDQAYFEVREAEKFDALCRLIDTTEDFYGLVFCRTKNDVDFVTSKLIDRGYDAEGLHGDISQRTREKILAKFRSKKVNILAATDVAARGLDIEELSHVINYALPQDHESYLHRIGRTGRAGKEGTAITFITPEEFRKLQFIKERTNTEITKKRIPQIQEVIDFKKTKILSEINSLIEYGSGANYLILAKELLRNLAPEEVVAALIKYNFQNELEENSYAKINDLFDRKSSDRNDRSGKRERGSRSRDRFEGRKYEKGSVKFRRDDDRDNFRTKSRKGEFREDKGKTRIFLAMGKKDNFDKISMLKMLSKRTGIPSEKISGLQISPGYSFFNVDKKEAKIILDTFNKEKGKRPVAEIAKPSK